MNEESLIEVIIKQTYTPHLYSIQEKVNSNVLSNSLNYTLNTDNLKARQSLIITYVHTSLLTSQTSVIHLFLSDLFIHSFIILVH